MGINKPSQAVFHNSKGLRIGSSQHGMTIIEVLASVAVISIMSLSVAYFASFKENSAKSQTVDAFNCSVQVNSILNSLRAEGQSAQFKNWYPHQSTNNYRYPASFVWDKKPDFLKNDFLHPSNEYVAIDWTPGAANSPFDEMRIHLAGLQTSSVNLIERLYNESSADLCGDASASHRGSTPELDAISERYSYMLQRHAGFNSATGASTGSNPQTVSTQFRIVPYNVLTGEELGSCPTGLASIPLGQTAQSSNLQAPRSDASGTVLRPRSDEQLGNPHIGYKVEVFTEVKENTSGSSSVVATCSGSQLFEHQRDYRTPTSPTVVAMVRNDTLDDISSTNKGFSARRNGGNSHTNEIQVTYRIENPKPGSFLLCRDLSRIPTVPSSIYGGQRAACMGAPLQARQPIPNQRGPGPQRFRRQSNAVPIQTATSDNAVYALQQLNHPDAGSFPTSQWVPCDQVTLCRKAPTSSKLTNNVGREAADPQTRATSSAYVQFTNTYNDLRPECSINLEVRATDEAGNRATASVNMDVLPARNAMKANASNLHLQGTSSQPISGANVVTQNQDNITEVARRTCGQYCRTGNAPGGTPVGGADLMGEYFDEIGGSNRTYGADGYWQTTACCETPRAPRELLLYMGMDSQGNLTDRALAFANRWKETFNCRPGWSKTTPYANALNLAASIQMVGHSQDVGETSNQRLEPHIESLDTFVRTRVNNPLYVSPTIPADFGPKEADSPACGKAILTQADYNAKKALCKKIVYSNQDYMERECTDAEFRADVEAKSTLQACEIPAGVRTQLQQNAPALLQMLNNGYNADGGKGVIQYF